MQAGIDGILPAPMTPSRARYVVTTFAVALAVVTYVDRVAISVAMPFIRADLGLTPAQVGWVLAAFGWAYALFEIPGGWLGDRIGSRRVLMRIVLWWSLFTAATGWAWSATSLIVIRALFGAGEAGAFPNLTRVLTTWLPVKERERAQATLWLATRVSGAFTPLLIASLIELMGWQRTFEVLGILGVIWAVFFFRWYRDAPSEHPAVNRAELAMLPPPKETAVAREGVPWRADLLEPAPSGCCPSSTCASLTDGGSTSTGCRPTCATPEAPISGWARCSPACRCSSAAWAAWSRRRRFPGWRGCPGASRRPAGSSP